MLCDGLKKTKILGGSDPLVRSKRTLSERFLRRGRQMDEE